jgi:transcriptional regulator with XRE-family HTH domain
VIIRKLRLEKGLSQEQLATMAGISPRTLQRIERGANASPETLKCLASVLETDFTELREDMTTSDHARAAPILSVKEQEAMESVRDIKSFYSHLATFVVVLIALTVMNLIVSPGYLWVIWVAFGWGIGVASHALSVFEITNFFGADWDRRQIQKRLNR